MTMYVQIMRFEEINNALSIPSPSKSATGIASHTESKGRQGSVFEQRAFSTTGAATCVCSLACLLACFPAEDCKNEALWG